MTYNPFKKHWSKPELCSELCVCVRVRACVRVCVRVCGVPVRMCGSAHAQSLRTSSPTRVQRLDLYLQQYSIVGR